MSKDAQNPQGYSIYDADLPWFRLYSDFAFDRTINELPEAIQARYVKILCLRSKGLCTKFCPNDLVFYFKLRKPTAIKTIDALKNAGLLNMDGSVHNWDKHQKRSDYARFRKRDQRARDKKSRDKSRRESRDGSRDRSRDESRTERNKRKEERLENVPERQKEVWANDPPEFRWE